VKLTFLCACVLNDLAELSLSHSGKRVAIVVSEVHRRHVPTLPVFVQQAAKGSAAKQRLNSINHFFAGTDLAHLLAHYKMFISALLGGPEPYVGQDIGAAHAHSRPQLNDSHFDTFLKHFRAALQEVGVRDDKAERVVRVLEGKRNVVLNRERAINAEMTTVQGGVDTGIFSQPGGVVPFPRS